MVKKCKKKSTDKEKSTYKEELIDKKEFVDLSDMPALEDDEEEVKEGNGLKILTPSQYFN